MPADMSHEDAPEDDPDREARDEAVEVVFHDEHQAEHEAAVEQVQVVVQGVEAQFRQDQIQAAQLPQGGANLPNEILPVHGEGLAELREMAANLRTLVAAAQARPAAEGTTCTWASMVCGIVGSISTALATIYAIKSYYGSGARLAAYKVLGAKAPTGGLHLRAGSDPGIAAIVKALEAPTDAQYWGNLARYVSANAPRPWDEQMLICELSADIYRFRMPTWSWSTPRAMLDAVTGLTASIQTKGLAATYAAMPSLASDGVPVPRAVGSKLLSLAIAKAHIDA